MDPHVQMHAEKIVFKLTLRCEMLEHQLATLTEHAASLKRELDVERAKDRPLVDSEFEKAFFLSSRSRVQAIESAANGETHIEHGGEA